MPNPISQTLDALGLYSPLRRAVRDLTDGKRRQRQREIRADLHQTTADVGAWAHEGGHLADPTRLFGIVSFTDIPLHAKFHCLVAKMMQLRGYTPVIFTLSGCRFAHRYFDLFGLDRLVMWDQLAHDADPAQTAQIVHDLLPAQPTVAAVQTLQLHGVDVGKHALSLTARRRVEGQLNLNDPATLAMLRDFLCQAVQSVLLTKAWLADNPLEKLFVRDAGYIPNGGIYETALARGIDCVVYEQGQRVGTWIFKRYTPATKGQHYFSLADTTWEQVKAQPWTAEQDAALDREFAGRYKPDSTDDTRRLMTGKRRQPVEAVRAELGLDPTKKTAVIFSQIAWDAAFFFGSCLFDDFEHWLFETVRFVAAECPQMNWVVKLHPFNVFKLQREDKTEESEMRLLRTLMPLPAHVRIMRADTDISTESLFPLVDYVLTVNGTVGMEFPCFGIPAVLAGTGRYNGRGFTIEPPTRTAYFDVLRTLHTVPRLDSSTQTRARQHFYTVVVRRQTDLSDAAPMELKRANEGQSDVHDNIHFTARSLDDFRAAHSIQRLGDWLTDSTDLDLLEPLA